MPEAPSGGGGGGPRTHSAPRALLAGALAVFFVVQPGDARLGLRVGHVGAVGARRARNHLPRRTEMARRTGTAALGGGRSGLAKVSREARLRRGEVVDDCEVGGDPGPAVVAKGARQGAFGDAKLRVVGRPCACETKVARRAGLGGSSDACDVTHKAPRARPGHGHAEIRRKVAHGRGKAARAGRARLICAGRAQREVEILRPRAEGAPWACAEVAFGTVVPEVAPRRRRRRWGRGPRPARLTA